MKAIYRVEQQGGGFGGLLVQTIDWAPRDKMLHSYELLARYVMPHFQGSIKSIKRSNEWVTSRQEALVAGRTAAIDRAHATYAERQR